LDLFVTEGRGFWIKAIATIPMTTSKTIETWIMVMSFTLKILEIAIHHGLWAGRGSLILLQKMQRHLPRALTMAVIE
jgi:hypothetical protein